MFRCVIVLLFGCYLLQANAQYLEEDPGSGSIQNFPLMPHDDEDLENDMNISGSGGDVYEETEQPTEVQEDGRKPTLPKTRGKDIVDESGATPSSPQDEVVTVETVSEGDKTVKQQEDDDENNDEQITSNAETKTVTVSGSFLQSTHFMAALVVGGCVGLLFAICVIMLLAYRMRKKDEGSYALDEQKKPASPSAYQYTQGQEYYA
ncbi:syndecan-2-like [Clavelina lepadiformis]|uniref:Syndecan n=1 Tax=Clavelina lepadiformis TaxID=159417 RepID=A0ABP0GY31_CLALP